MMTVSPASRVSLPRGMIMRPLRLIHATNRLFLVLSFSSGIPSTGESPLTLNSSASALSATILYRVSMLLPMEFCMALTYCRMMSAVSILGYMTLPRFRALITFSKAILLTLVISLALDWLAAYKDSSIFSSSNPVREANASV